MTGFSEPADVRMRGFAVRRRVADAWAWIAQQVAVLGAEPVPLFNLAGRVLAEDIVAGVDVPGFDRAMMDGFAVQASDTAGASSYNRLLLHVIGEVLPGAATEAVVAAGQAIRIMTGAPMPVGADAVLPVEKAVIDDERVEAIEEVTPGKHVGRRGEDIACSSIVLQQGRRLRPQDVGVLSSIGVDEARVVRQPRVRIILTGNELLPAGSRPEGARIADANGPMLAALVRRDGGVPVLPGVIRDDPAAIHQAMASPETDIVLISGGSSVGQEDHAPSVLARHGTLAIHGVAMRPSSPAGMGTLDGRPVFLLPGNPVSCLCAYDFFAGRAVRLAAGLNADWPYHRVRLRLRRKLVSVVGRVDYARVRVEGDEVEPLAISGAALLTSTTRADGFVVVGEDSEGFPHGAEVDVWLYD